jgi:hypothetical protein
MHREPTPELDVLSITARGVADAKIALRGGPGATLEVACVATRNHEARTACRRYLESLVLAGSVGIAAVATPRAGFSRLPHQPGVSGPRIGGDDTITAADKLAWLAGNRWR